MRKIKIAQIGVNTNSHSHQIFNSLIKQSDIFEVAGICFPANEHDYLSDRVASLGEVRELTLEEVLNDPTIEAVTVETDEIYTTKYAIMAAEHGKHVHMEKPGGCELADFEKLVETVKRTGTVFHTGYMYRYNPAVRDLLRRVRDGELGDIISVEAQMNCIHPPRVREWLNGFPGGMMFFLGCHLVDLVMLLQGEPDQILPLNCHSGADGVDSPDFGMAVMKYPHGVSFVKTTAVEHGGFNRRQLVVNGTKGTIEIKPLERGFEKALVSEQVFCDFNEWHREGERTVSEPYDRYDTMMASFAAMVRGEITNPYTLDYELALYKNVLRCCGVKVD